MAVSRKAAIPSLCYSIDNNNMEVIGMVSNIISIIATTSLIKPLVLKSINMHRGGRAAQK
jgi:hypothetical protein